MKKSFSVLIAIALLTLSAHAQLTISEVMYDPDGTDSGREWVEIENTGTDTIDITKWKFFESNVNHTIDEIDGAEKELRAGEFGIITTDKTKFLVDNPGFNGKIFKSSFSLTNTGEFLSFKNEGGVAVTEYSYDTTLGANGNGNSLQKGSSRWLESPPTPGSAYITSTTPPPTSTTPTVPTTPTPVVNGTGTKYVVPKIFGAITFPPVAVAGVEAELKGQNFTSDGRSVSNSSYSWNFGDGRHADGQIVKHRYKYPGVYYVSLDISSFVNNASVSTLEYAPVEVIAPDVSISEGKDEKDLPYWQIKNETEYVLEVSGWIIQRGGSSGEHYILPRNTFVSPETTVKIPQEVTKFKSNTPLSTLELLFPNTEVAATFGHSTTSVSANSENQSSSKIVIESTIQPLPSSETKPREANSQTVTVKVAPPLAAAGLAHPPTPLAPESEVETLQPNNQDIVTAAVTMSNQDTNSIVWYTIPLLLLVVSAGLFLGSRKDTTSHELYSIIEDEGSSK